MVKEKPHYLYHILNDIFYNFRFGQVQSFVVYYRLKTDRLLTEIIISIVKLNKYEEYKGKTVTNQKHREIFIVIHT